MSIHRLTAGREYSPDEIIVMGAAYAAAMLELGLVDRNDPLCELVARSIITIAATGERDPEKLKERAIHALGVHKTGEMRKIDAA